MLSYYVEDSTDAKRNRITVIGSCGVSYPAVLSYKFSGEDTTGEPVKLQEAKDWCAIDGCDYDTRMTMLIKAARKKVERVKQMSLINRTVTATVKPGTTLPYGPVIEITSITDEDGTTYELTDTTDFPDTNLTVVYTAGPTEDEGLSEDYKVEILQQIAYMLQNAGDGNASGSISPMIRK